ADGGGRRLTREPLADEGAGRNARLLGGCTDPQHGGCATASAAHPGDDGVDSELADVLRQVGEDLVFLVAVRGAEGLVADELDAGISGLQLRFQDREDLVAAEQIVPEEGDLLALEVPVARGERRKLGCFRATR